jgi:hypothetical protein
VLARVNQSARWAALGLAGLLIQDYFHGLEIKGGWFLTTVALLCFAVLVVLVTWEPLSLRLPTLRLQRLGRESGFSIEVRPPAGGSTRRLKREMESLASDMFEALNARPAPYIDSMREHDEVVRKMDKAANEEERNAVWREYTYSSIEAHSAEKHDLQQRFGGRLEYVVGELERRGLLERAEVTELLWFAGSWGWLGAAAQRLNALAKRL